MDYSITRGYYLKHKKVAVIISFLRDNLINNVVELAYRNTGIPEDDFYVWARKSTSDSVNISGNRMIEESECDIVCLIADDCLPQKDYLKHALIAMSTLPDGFGFVSLNEGFDQDRPSHMVVDKRMIPLLGGEILHSGYGHNCSDVELKERSLAMGRYVFAKDAVVIHNHPIFNKDVKRDKFYDISGKTNKADQQLLKERRKAGWPEVSR